VLVVVSLLFLHGVEQEVDGGVHGEIEKLDEDEGSHGENQLLLGRHLAFLRQLLHDFLA